MNNIVRLQNFGWYEGKPAGNIKVGDKVWWNFGGSSIVTGIIRQTDKTIWVAMKSTGKEGVENIRKFLKTRLLVY